MDGSITVERCGQGLVRVQEGSGKGAITLLMWDKEARAVAEMLMAIVGDAPADLTLDHFTEP